MFCRRAAIFGLSILSLVIPGCWFTASSPMPRNSHATSSSTGTLGRHQFATKSEVDAFDSEVIKWFSKQGFTVDASTTFYELDKRADWKTPGVLLCRQYDSANRVYVFIPECYRPETNEQIVAYHVEFSGTAEEVRQRDQDFESLEQEIRRRFPSLGSSPPIPLHPQGPVSSSLGIGIKLMKGEKPELVADAYNVDFRELLESVFKSLPEIDKAPVPSIAGDAAILKRKVSGRCKGHTRAELIDQLQAIGSCLIEVDPGGTRAVVTARPGPRL